jgi:hypothetical protein
MTPGHEAALQRIRARIRDRRRTATCVGFGPRFLHSTGQACKGGPNTGVFLQITCDDAADLPVHGQRYTFGVVKAAQARGDLEVLAARGRRALPTSARTSRRGSRPWSGRSRTRSADGPGAVEAANDAGQAGARAGKRGPVTCRSA